jgi:hypothetical protein
MSFRASSGEVPGGMEYQGSAPTAWQRARNSFKPIGISSRSFSCVLAPERWRAKGMASMLSSELPKSVPLSM